MFLKRIELTGFKSFANKTELEFVKGISAVVGPNGSGKSNISDAIRWVLGEQSAKSLRGGKMEDIIFAGSDSRKAVNFGEVSLTLDNSDEQLPLDFHEITVTRRLHRSGDSEYFINKQACRLRDITELFMDTGIGKEAYSIIGQGRIEEILSTRSEDRRGIFEEASGIVKYKSRKKEAQKKLDNTEQNLLRIHDLISELEDQIDPLREQSEKATLYKELKDKLKSNEISMYVFQIEQIHSAWTEANEQLQKLEHKQLELSTVVNQHDAHLETHRATARELEQELEQLQDALLHISEEYEKCEGYGDVLKEREKNLSNNQEQMQQTVQVGEKRTAQIEAEKAVFEHKFTEISRQVEELQLELTREEQRLLGVISGTESEAEENLKAELLETLNRAAQAKNEVRYIDQQLENLQRRTLKLDEDHQKWLDQKALLAEQKKNMQQKLVLASDEITAIREAFMKKNEQLKTEQSMLDETQMILRRTEQKNDSLISRRDTMREMQNDYDGFQQGVKEVLKSRKSSSGLQGVHGAVAELVKVPAKVETAIETALGGALQHIVMENEAASRAAISFLKQRKLGRATFLPLDVLKGRYIGEHDLQGLVEMQGFVGIAADLITFDQKYKSIVTNLLGNVMISENLEQANRLAAKCRYRYRVVTLDGDVVNAGGSMSGGSNHRRNTSLLGRQRQIEEIDKQIVETEQQIKQIEVKLDQLKRTIASIHLELEQMRQQGEQKRLEEQQIRAETQSLDNEAKSIEAQLQLYNEDRSDVHEEEQTHDKQKADIAVSLVKLQEHEAFLQQSIREAERYRKANETAKEELQSHLTELKVKTASTAQEKQSIQDQLQRFTTELNQAKEELQMSLNALGQLEQEIEENELETVKQLEQLNHHRIKRQQISESIDFKRADRANWLQQLEDEESETKDTRIELKKVEEKLHQTEVKANRLDVELENLLKNLAEDYELSYELAKQRHPIPEDVPAVQQLVKELKREITQLGEVNLGAIEEFQRVNERYQFLSQQKEDLIEAKEALYKVIREMDEEMSKRFISTFEEIRVQFAGVFTKLFGGGRADLILSEPDQLLETGIEIVAQPPGKKLQNLQLLSGGERALTAIALLFAILNVKPVPFCVLDEVEAALDEANVSRFAQYLREFSEETQFIVVTHRKGTMEEADVLYGVTMEEGGVSKLVSVKLEEDEAVSA